MMSPNLVDIAGIWERESDSKSDAGSLNLVNKLKNENSTK
jgi:hypothetical protein